VYKKLQKRTAKLISKYEKQIEELTGQCNMKSDECSMAWSLVESTNQELDRLKIELHQKLVQSDTFGTYKCNALIVFLS
jgi:kinesin family protein C2/C3